MALPNNRCGLCDNCRRVIDCQRSVSRALNQSFTERFPNRIPIGEDARLIWNRTVEENPCMNPPLEERPIADLTEDEMDELMRRKQR